MSGGTSMKKVCVFEIAVSAPEDENAGFCGVLLHALLLVCVEIFN